MLSRLKAWYRTLSNGQQVVFLFLTWLVYWFIMENLIQIVWPDEEPKTMWYTFFKGVWMAIVFMIVFHWKKLKLLFRKKKPEETNSLNI